MNRNGTRAASRLARAALIAALLSGNAGARKKHAPEPAPLDRYVEEASSRAAAPAAGSPGSIWSPGARLADAARDLRAAQVDDVVTILIAENASAVAKGSTKSARASSAKGSIGALAGVKRATSPWANLAQFSGDQQLSGDASTSRETVLSTTLTARVVRVLPGGAMVLEGSKDLQVNSERQSIVVRGVVRPADLSPANVVRSDRLAQLEVRVNGKGVVNDAIRRPFFLYRLLTGLLPF